VGAILPPSFAVPTFLLQHVRACTTREPFTLHELFIPVPPCAASRYPGKWRCGGWLHVVRCTVPAMGSKKACMACPSRWAQRAPGAYPTRCVGLRGRRVRALKQQRELGACSIELVSLSESLPITHSADAEATPRSMGRRIGKDK